jgi:uncharacterized protein YjbI with pentapeptide repeats
MTTPHPLAVRLDLRRKNFSGQNLAEMTFHGTDLYQANFDGADLSGASFVNCFVAEASFQHADCTNLQATRTNFYRANFRGANLSEALLWNCVLAGADLRDATLRRVTLTLDCNSFEEIRMDRTASAELAYLFGRARTPHRAGWLRVIDDRDLARLARIFQR